MLLEVVLVQTIGMIDNSIDPRLDPFVVITLAIEKDSEDPMEEIRLAHQGIFFQHWAEFALETMDIAIFRMTRGDGEFSLSHESESEWIEWSGGAQRPVSCGVEVRVT